MDDDCFHLGTTVHLKDARHWQVPNAGRARRVSHVHALYLKHDQAKDPAVAATQRPGQTITNKVTTLHLTTGSCGARDSEALPLDAAICDPPRLMFSVSYASCTG